MEKLFFTVLGMSATGSLVILAVLLARLALRKAPKAFSYALWAVALFRLLCPFTLDSAFSLLPSVRMVDAAGRGGGTDQVIQIQTGIPALNSQVNGFLADHPYQEGQPTETGGEPGEELAPVINQPGPVPDWRTVPAAIWLAGTAALLGYGALSLLGLRRRLAGSVPLEGEKNVRLAGHIPSPFVLGLVRPVIYLPSDLNEGERDYILLHERTHIRRFDHVTRGLAWLAAAVHWFNPMVWLAFYLAGRDMEMSCDEAVLRKMGREIRADYSASLLRLSQGGKLPAGPLAFGGSGFQSRIKNILNYKKPAFWVAALALAGVCVVGAALATNRAPGLFIDPDRVVSYTAADSSSYTSNPDHTSVSTDADRQKDLVDPAKQRPLSKGKGDELVRLVNAHRKSVYGQGELTLSGSEHQLVRMDCADGGWYLLDYWYWNGFSFNPLHYGEDSYTTLVTYYGPDGKAGTTWQMEYDFDRAYKDWLNGLPSADAESPTPDDDGMDLSYEVGQTDVGPFVRMTGKVYGQALERSAVWWPTGMEELYGGHSGGLSMRYTFAGGWAELMAWWADEEHKSVTLSSKTSAMLSSYMPCGWWEFTVDLSGEQGRVASMEARGGETTGPNPVKMYPEIITSQEAVFAARIAAKLLTAAEDFYHNYDGPIPPGPAETVRPTPKPAASHAPEPSPSVQPSPKPTASPVPSAEPTPKPSPTPAPTPKPSPVPTPPAVPTPNASWLETGIMTTQPYPQPTPPPGALDGFIWHPWGFFRGNSMRWEIAPAPSNGNHIRCTYANEVGLSVVLLLCREDADTGIVPDIVSQLTVPAGETRSMVYDIPADGFREYYLVMEEPREGRSIQGYLAVNQY